MQIAARRTRSSTLVTIANALALLWLIGNTQYYLLPKQAFVRPALMITIALWLLWESHKPKFGHTYLSRFLATCLIIASLCALWLIGNEGTIATHTKAHWWFAFWANRMFEIKILAMTVYSVIRAIRHHHHGR